jgi:hypothetical protein
MYVTEHTIFDNEVQRRYMLGTFGFRSIMRYKEGTKKDFNV